MKPPLQLVIASGPFTLPSNLSYEPLNDILKYVVENQPNILILMGPFIEENHEGINNGQLTETFDALFEKIIENIMTTLQEIDVEIIIMCSAKDAHHHPVYPTPAYKINKDYHKLTLVSDPCMVNINGLIIGGTTPDILFDISNSELYQDKTLSTPVDRLARLASHLLNQQSFYPLYPPNSEMNVDHELLEQHGIFECIPHILILPSTLRHFIKNINGCLVINPERTTKGYGAGTFSRLEINPGSSTSICNRSSCQVLRV
ncbi:unnamed protein product [Brassicogethes aeneus]|uniref:DNA polymerase alpha subunit B n=1 Tax=Brassicogethes aeneus TaxID=1431903 RepID=A0A9P0FF13_BRAAE|nr:unnamed protein product [Brassicogethes aeneus]